MLWLGGCPRCGGDLFDERDYTGATWVACLQCGGILTAVEEHLLRNGRHSAAVHQWTARTV